MQCKFNHFTKKPDSKTAFILQDGEPIFTETTYLLNPIYIHSRSPKFTLVSKGKHVSGFFEACGNAYLGDYKKQALIIFMRGEVGFDLFQTDLPPTQAKAMLCAGQLNDLFLQARQVV